LTNVRNASIDEKHNNEISKNEIIFDDIDDEYTKTVNSDNSDPISEDEIKPVEPIDIKNILNLSKMKEVMFVKFDLKWINHGKV